MSMRATVAQPTERFTGIGLHSGKEAWFQVRPASHPGQGILFRSHSSGRAVAASVLNVVSTNRSTCLGADQVRVDTVEHVLSACYGFGVTDAEIVFEGRELPIGDGSSLPFYKLLLSVGLRTTDVPQEELKLDRDVVVTDGAGGVLCAVPSDHFWISCVVDYSSFPSIGVQAAIYDGVGYHQSVAPARTYGFHHELDALRAAGLGLGANYENVVALDSTGKPDVHTPLRMHDELVRHKILDLIGDLSLSQKNIKVGIVAHRPSHTLNASLTRKILGAGGESGVI